MSKKPKHSASAILESFSSSSRAKNEAIRATQERLSKGVLCEGCLAELTIRIDKVMHFKYLLARSNKKIANQRRTLKLHRKQFDDLRKYFREQKKTDFNLDTNLHEHLMKQLGNQE